MEIPLNQVIGLCGAVAMLAVIVVGVIAAGWDVFREQVRKNGKVFGAVMTVCAICATIEAQKPPTPPSVKGINLFEIGHDAKGFDVGWNYGDTDPAALSGKRVKLRAYIRGMDYVLDIGEVGTATTNYHVNALMRGFPKDWMKNDWEVEARIENFVSIIHNGGDAE